MRTRDDFTRRLACSFSTRREDPHTLSEVAMQGTIKRIIRDRGFGFIRTADGQEVFFHRSSLQGLDFDALKEGASVELEVERGDKGPRAANVRPSQT
jgi:CspA family cold shock protein